MKFLMLLFSLLPFFNNDFNKKELNMKCQYEEVSEIKYEYGNYSIIEHNNKIEILLIIVSSSAPDYLHSPGQFLL